MPTVQEDQTAWLGGEAHVRRQDGGRRWVLPPQWRQAALAAGAFTAGTAIAGGIAAIACHARRDTAERPREGARPMKTESRPERRFTASALLAAFMTGVVVGTAVTLFTTPEPGHRLRRRISRGARTAQEELAGVAFEAREALEALTTDARQTIRRTARRLGNVIEATLEAVRTEAELVRGQDHE